MPEEYLDLLSECIGVKRRDGSLSVSIISVLTVNIIDSEVFPVSGKDAPELKKGIASRTSFLIRCRDQSTKDALQRITFDVLLKMPAAALSPLLGKS